jgi:hypothetical protein
MDFFVNIIFKTCISIIYHFNKSIHIIYIGGDFLVSPNKLLFCIPSKFNLGKCHYVTGKNISVFSNLLCIENSLTNLTCNCKNMLRNKFNLK